MEPAVPRIKLPARRAPMQHRIMRLILASTRPRPVQAPRHRLPDLLPRKPRAVQVPVILRARRLAREPQPARIRPQVLVALERQARRPIRIRPVRPRRGTPARIEEVDRVGDVVGAEHVAQRDEDLRLGGFVGLAVDDEGLVGDDGDKEDAATGEEVGVVEGLPDGVVAALRGRIEEQLFGFVPEDLVRRELKEDFGVGGHLEGFDGGALPVREGRGEGDGGGLEDADGEGGDGVVGDDAGTVGVGHGDGPIAPGNVGDNGVEEEAGVVLFEELGGLAVEEGVEAALVDSHLVGSGEAIVSRVLSC